MKISNKDVIMINKVFKDFEVFLKTGEADRDDCFDLGKGLCHNIFDLFYDNSEDIEFYINIDNIRDKLWKSWKYFTGTLVYPVPFRLDEQQDREILQIVEESIHEEYSEAYYYSDNLYDKNTDYGRLRLDLYQHIKDNIFDVINKL